MATFQEASASEATVSPMLTGSRVLSGFRASFFAAAARACVSVNEFVLRTAGEKLRAGGAGFSGVFEPGDSEAAQVSTAAPLNLMALWRRHRDECRSFGAIVDNAREGRLPGMAPARIGFDVPDENAALAAMRKEQL